mgnify:CR=1 FL=1
MSSPEDEFTTRCQCKRNTPTNMRCSRCNVPICAHCSNFVPAGQICKTCLRGHTNHLYQFGGNEILRGLIASLVVATLLGWILANGERFGLLAAIWGGLFHGIATSEACLRATGHKRGWQFEAIAGGSAAIGILVGFSITTASVGSLSIVLLSSYFYALLGISVFIAVTRLRSF